MYGMRIYGLVHIYALVCISMHIYGLAHYSIYGLVHHNRTSDGRTSGLVVN